MTTLPTAAELKKAAEILRRCVDLGSAALAAKLDALAAAPVDADARRYRWWIAHASGFMVKNDDGSVTFWVGTTDIESYIDAALAQQDKP